MLNQQELVKRASTSGAHCLGSLLGPTEVRTREMGGGGE